MGMQRGLCPLAKKVRCHTPAHILRNVSSSTFYKTTVAATIDREIEKLGRRRHKVHHAKKFTAWYNLPDINQTFIWKP